MIAALQRLIDAMKGRKQAPAMLATIAEAWLAQGVTESAGSNAGPDVSWFIHDGGGAPKKRPPWCAYFVSSCCRQVERTGTPIEYIRTGRAVSHWLKAPEGRRLTPPSIWTDPEPRGLVFVRTRVSSPTSDAKRVLDGVARQGHVGIVVGVDAEERTITCVAGNSSGYGHDRVSGGGAVATEVITEGDAAWERLVGFVRVTGHGGKA